MSYKVSLYFKAESSSDGNKKTHYHVEQVDLVDEELFEIGFINGDVVGYSWDQIWKYEAEEEE